MKRILLTGATGFLGSHLVKELVKNFKVNCLIRRDLKFAHPNIIIFKGDLFSNSTIKDATGGVSAVIHLAAQKYNTKDLKQIRRVNVKGTKNLLRFAGDAHFIYISTWLATYHKKTGFYGQTKKEAEEEVKKYGKNFTILRLPHIFGPSKTSLIFTKYFLPAYLLLRYRVKPIYHPVEVSQIVPAIKQVVNQKKFFGKSFYVVDQKTFVPFT